MTKHYKLDLRLSIWYHLALDTRLLPSHWKKKSRKSLCVLRWSASPGQDTQSHFLNSLAGLGDSPQLLGFPFWFDSSPQIDRCGADMPSGSLLTAHAESLLPSSDLWASPLQSRRTGQGGFQLHRTSCCSAANATLPSWSWEMLLETPFLRIFQPFLS